MSLRNFAEPNFQNDPGLTAFCRFFDAAAAAHRRLRNRRGADMATRDERGKPQETSSLARSDGLLGVLQSAGSGHAPGRASLFGKMTNLVKGG